MTPAARLSAAITVLDSVLSGTNAERALTAWARGSRFAGSGDRQSVRDLVFAALRCRRSFAALGGGLTGRGLVLGSLRAAGTDPAPLFTGEGHAPQPVTAAETGRLPQGAAALDCPDWLLPLMRESLGAETEPVLLALRHRAPVFLRVNLMRATREEAMAALAADGIGCAAHPDISTALEVTENARKVQNSVAYSNGMVELQDASSQAVVAALPLHDGMRVLDLCAGGGGKALAMAAAARMRLWAHDSNPARLVDLGPRALRAKATITITEKPERTAPYDVILTDVPCSGSGSWRRDPEGKWALTPARLAQLKAVQAQILDRAAGMVEATGALAYATCSLLRCENEDQIAAFLGRRPGWTCRLQQRFSPLHRGDGFFLAVLTRESAQPTQL